MAACLQMPEGIFDDPPLAVDDGLSGADFMDILIDGCTRKVCRSQRKYLMHTAQIHAGMHARMGKDALDLRCKQKEIFLLVIK